MPGILRSRKALISLGLAISALFAYLTLRGIDWAEMWRALTGVSLPILSLVLVTKGTGFVAMAWRSRITTAQAGPLPFNELFASHLLGFTANNILPFRVGELIRVDYLGTRTETSRAFLLATAAVERLLDAMLLLALFVLAAQSVLTDQGLSSGVGFLVVATVAALVGVLVLGRSRFLPGLLERWLTRISPAAAATVSSRAESIRRGFEVLSSPRRVVGAVLATLCYWAMGFASLTLVAKAFGLALPWWGPALILALVGVGVSVPSSPGYVGTYHYFAALALTLLGVEQSVAASFALIAHAMAIGPYTLLGVMTLAPWIHGSPRSEPEAVGARDPAP